MSALKRILIVRFSSIGDIVLTTPVIRCLKKQLPEVEIHYLTKKSYVSILENNPYITKVHVLDDSLIKTCLSLRDVSFDVVIDLHKNTRSRIVKLILGVKSFSFDKLNFEKFIYTSFKINKLPNIHIVDRYMDAVKNLGVANDDEGLDYFIPEKDEVEHEWLPESHRQGYVAFAIGGQHATKKLPTHKIIQLCDQINKPIILLGGKEDFEEGEKIELFFKSTLTESEERFIQQDLNKKTVIFNGCGKFNLNQSASILNGSIAVFTHDTGLMHIAAALKKQVFSIWGNTSPFFGMYPYKTSFTIFENNKIDCRPCSKIGYSACPKGHFKCMNDQVFDFYLP